eukprot:TRINITY_DN3769_c0_g1_i1.p1 TRINITY_DN3769_c0_g1~~TRINITY_DN3769_c0_g1_i1.p1  ORF type:complete len:700 (-),score=58.58 TRINITY_DN3769_c0_g1_i1:888-2987(-)
MSCRVLLPDKLLVVICTCFVLFSLSTVIEADEETTNNFFLPGERYIYDAIYSHFGTPKGCVRLLDSDGEIGCSAPNGGVVGNLYPIQTQQEYSEFTDEKYSWSGWFDRKAIVLESTLFTKENIEGLHNVGIVSGVLVTHFNGTNYSAFSSCGPNGEPGFSPASKHPNKEWGLYPESNYEWNRCGTNWMYESMPFPVFALDAEDTQSFLEKAKQNKHDDSWPKWAVEFNLFMHGSRDSRTCLRRKYCDPVGGQSVYGGLNDHYSDDKDVVLIMTQMDSTAIFHDLATGGESVASGVSALLGAVDALTRIDRNLQEKELIFAFWTGETYGYLGSSTFVTDIQGFKCDDDRTTSSGRPYCKHPYRHDYDFKNFSLDRITAIIDVNQIALLDAQEPTLFVHREPSGEEDVNLFNVLKSVSRSSNITVELAAPGVTALELPPSSLHSFLKARRSIPGVVLTDFKDAYKNTFYHSRFDDLTYIGTEGVRSTCLVASFIARAAWALVKDSDQIPADLVANCTYVQQLMDCLVQDNACQLKQELMGVRNAPQPPNHYTGTYLWRRRISVTSKFVMNNMIAKTAKQRYLVDATAIGMECNHTSDCNEEYNMTCLWGLCRNFSVNYHDAVSPAVDYNRLWGTWDVMDMPKPVPLWTEPRWDSIGLRLFKQNNFLIDIFTLVVGLVELLVSFVFLWYVRTSLRKRFVSLA